MFWFAILSVLSAVELVFIGSWFSFFFPPKAVPLTVTMFDLYRQQITPERDVFFLRFLAAAGLGIFILLMRARDYWRQPGRWRALKLFTGFQALAVAAQAFCLFKLLLYRGHIWLNGFYLFLGAGLLGAIFWPELCRVLDHVDRRLKNPAPMTGLSRWGSLFSLALIAGLIWVPDTEGALAKMFIGEQFHHIDWFLTAAGWAHISGNTLGIDQVSRYGIGAPVVVSQIAKRLFGQFSYGSALAVMMAISVAYFWLWFALMRYFFGNFAWGLIGALAGWRLQFLHSETFPLIFTYPQVTPLRCFFDAVLFILLVVYIRRPHQGWLWLAGVAGGLAVYWVTGEGLYLLCGFYGFLFLREWAAITAGDRQLPATTLPQRLGLFFIPWGVTFACVWLTVGNYAWGREFWDNQLEFMRIYGSGQGSVPMINNLVPGFVLQAGWAFLLPVLYVLALVVTIGLMMEKKIKRDGLVIGAAAIYLLADFHYQAMVSNNTTAYLRVGVVIAFVATYALIQCFKSSPVYARRLAQMIILGIITVSIAGNHQFLLHPNVFNFARNPMSHPVVSHNPPGRSSYFNHLFVSFPDAFKLPANSLGEQQEFLLIENNFVDDQQLKDFYHHEINYAKDAQLIDALVPPGGQAALISSFEVPILMQANRRPFFYMFDLINSRPRRMRNFTVTLLYSVDRLKREIERIDRLRPPYVFMEKVYLTPQVPLSYQHDSQDLITLLNEIFKRYTPYREGEYLVALKRR